MLVHPLQRWANIELELAQRILLNCYMDLASQLNCEHQRWPNASLMLDQRHRRWASISSALSQRIISLEILRIRYDESNALLINLVDEHDFVPVAEK